VIHLVNELMVWYRLLVVLFSASQWKILEKFQRYLRYFSKGSKSIGDDGHLLTIDDSLVMVTMAPIAPLVPL
jgi:hypothetical protein